MLKGKTGHIAAELKEHVPFTLFGAVTGIVLMLIFRNLSERASFGLFYVFHPGHVILSAMVTASMFELHSKKTGFLTVLVVGIVGSLGVTTLSDSLIPYAGELLLGMHAHTHTPAHEAESFAHSAHIGFIEGWYIVIPAAILGVLIAYFRPRTKLPHAVHVLLSMWASSFHILMAAKGHIPLTTALAMLVFLFIAVWLPCCFSDIVFPLLFVKAENNNQL